MTIPNLMPHQMEPFNGDHFIEAEFLKLKDRYFLKSAIELGTCLGSTTLWLAKNFGQVYTVEINPDYHAVAMSRFREHGLTNVTAKLNSSVDELDDFMKKAGDSCIVYIDSHWLEVCPMQHELQIIAESGYQPVIAIHDFLVPGEPELGYDSIGGQPFELSWIQPKLNAIYGTANYDWYYNSKDTSTDIRRGIIYITPKTF